MLRGLVEGLLGGHQKKVETYKYESLSTTPYLHSPEYLGELYRGGNKEQKELVYDHMLRYQVIDEEFDGYLKLADKIENDLWRD